MIGGMTPPMPLPVRVAAGLLVTAVEQVRGLPRLALELPVTAVSQALQASMRVQQKVTELAIKGDRVLGAGTPIEDEPPWATFDDDPPPAGRPGRRNGRGAPDPADRATVTALRRPADRPPAATPPTGPLDDPGPIDPGSVDPGSVDPGSVDPAPVPAGPGDTRSTDAPSTGPLPADAPSTDAPSADALPAGAPAAEALPAGTSPAGALPAGTTPAGTAPADTAPVGTPPAPADDATADDGPAVLPGYAELTIPQLRGKLRHLGLADLRTLLEWEHAHGDRPPFVTMLSNRIATLSEQ
jgi:hypothetical protein